MYGKIIQRVKNKLVHLKSKFLDFINGVNQVVFNQKLTPESIYIEPTNICNANCIFCAYQFYDAPKKNMDFDTLKKVLNEVSLLSINRINLTPFAGEILVDKTIIDKIKIIDSYKFNSVATYTNLLNLHRVNIKEFLNSGLTELYVSTAPLKKEIYEKIYRSKRYEKLLENLILILKEFSLSETKTIKTIYIEFRSNLTLNECLNLDDYKNYIEPLITKDIKVSAMRTFDSWMGAIKENDLLDGMSIAKQNGRKIIPCSRLNNVQILSNGDMRVCGCRFNNFSETDIFYIGNIRTKSIKDAYNSDTVKSIKASFLKNNPPDECQKCSWYS